LIIVDYIEQTRVTKFAMCGPFDKTDFDDDLRFDPVRAQSRETDGFGERRFRNLEVVQLCAQIKQQLRIKTGANPARKNELAVFIMTDEQRAESNTLALRISKTADDKVVRQLALHFQPLFRAAMLVDRAAPFCDHAFPTFTLRAFPRRGLVNYSHALQRFTKGQLGEQ